MSSRRSLRDSRVLGFVVSEGFVGVLPAGTLAFLTAGDFLDAVAFGGLGITFDALASEVFLAGRLGLLPEVFFCSGCPSEVKVDARFKVPGCALFLDIFGK